MRKFCLHEYSTETGDCLFCGEWFKILFVVYAETEGWVVMKCFMIGDTLAAKRIPGDRENLSGGLEDNNGGVSGAFELALHADGVFQSGKWSGLHAEKAAGMRDIGREILILYLF